MLVGQLSGNEGRIGVVWQNCTFILPVLLEILTSSDLCTLEVGEVVPGMPTLLLQLSENIRIFLMMLLTVGKLREDLNFDPLCFKKLTLRYNLKWKAERLIFLSQINRKSEIEYKMQFAVAICEFLWRHSRILAKLLRAVIQLRALPIV